MKQLLRNTICMFVLLPLLTGACKEKESATIISYIYIDRSGVLHTQNGCKAVTKIYGGNQPVKPLRAENVTKEMLDNICSQCVTEKQLQYLLDIADYRNRDDVEFEEEVDTLAIEDDVEYDGE